MKKLYTHNFAKDSFSKVKFSNLYRIIFLENLIKDYICYLQLLQIFHDFS